MKKSILNTLAMTTVSLMSLIMSGCFVAGGTGGALAPAWYNVYGVYCGSGDPSPGCNYFSDGYKIVAGEDPYYGGSTLSFGTWTYYDTYGYPAQFSGWAWQSPTGVIYDEYGSSLNSDGDSDSRDLIANAAEMENQTVRQVGKNFAEKFALAEDAGIKIASTLNEWATLSKKQKRARTDQDVADFSKRLYGISLDQAKASIDQAKAGNMGGLEAASSDVAVYWGTNPETVKVILKGWYKDQLSQITGH